MTTLGNRIKANYERPARHMLLRRTPVIVRVDGRAFHTYTRGMDRPFDRNLALTMVASALAVGNEMQGFKAGYIQSDEASFLLTDYDTLQTEQCFGYAKSKVETIAASVMTAAFNRGIGPSAKGLAHFDARAFNVPREEVVNYFLWRCRDWERNSLSMYCNSFFSHKELQGKGKAERHEMLHGIGKNWATDIAEWDKNGSWVFQNEILRTDIVPGYGRISEMLDPLIYCDKPEYEGEA